MNKTNCNKLKTYTINLKATKIAPPKFIANKLTKDIKWNPKNVSIQKEAEKEKEKKGQIDYNKHIARALV